MKPVLIGIDNPHSDDPRHALRPHPQNSAGHRLARMFVEAAEYTGHKLTLIDYEDGFDRRNILDVVPPEMGEETASRRLHDMLVCLEGRDVACLGHKVTGIMRLPRQQWLQGRGFMGFTYYTIPHPSGLNRIYNNPHMRRKVGELLLNMYIESR